MKLQVMRVYMILSICITLFFLLIVMGIEIYPSTQGNNDFVVLQQANFQLARAQFLAKDVLTLEYRSIQYHSQAISEIQTVLPVFIQVQSGLSNGDATLGLPKNQPDTVLASLSASQSDYSAIATALKVIISTPDKVPDITEVDIVLTHQNNYITEMYQVVTLLQENAESKVFQLMFIKIIFLVLAFILVILKYALFTHALVSKQISNIQVNE